MDFPQRGAAYKTRSQVVESLNKSTSFLTFKQINHAHSAMTMMFSKMSAMKLPAALPVLQYFFMEEEMSK